MVESTASDYFVLYVRHQVDADTMVELPVLVKKGEADTTTLAENVAALPAERYRVEKYLVADPADIDGDCIDDITELQNLGSMNPVNPAAAIELSDGALAILDRETFEDLSYEDPILDNLPDGLEYLRFILFDMDTDQPGIYFMNTSLTVHHSNFMDAVGLEWDQVIRGVVAYNSELTAPDGSSGVYSYWLVPFSTHYPFSLTDRSHTILAASMQLLDDNLALYVRNDRLPFSQANLALYRESRINLVFDEDIYPEISFQALNPGEGYGLLRVRDPDERPHPREIVIYEALPNELPRVSGIVTTAPQTPLSHVNLRAVQDGVPNAFIRDALDDTEIDALLGSYVHYTVTEDGWTLRATTPEDVEAHYAASRPATEQTPQRDLTVTQVTALSNIEFDDWTAFGVKAANVAVLRTLDFPTPEATVPNGFALPFYFYDEFMKHNGFYDDIEEMLADADFQTNLATQESELKKLRKQIKEGETPEWMAEALEEMHATFPEGTSLRYRSSTNNEDLPGFNGAGLYDSKTQHPEETEEDGIAKSLKQVYASLWNFRAFTEREFHRIDHLAAAMGVLVHPNYSNELANGVAVSFDPVYGKDGSYYINTQLGEDLVTNPETLSVPEEILLNPSGSFNVLAKSNLLPPGKLLLSLEQLDQLRDHIEVIHEEFEELYNPEPGKPFAIEVEFKITSDNILSIKQARPWVFDAVAAAIPTDNTSATGAPTITGTAQVNQTLTADVTGIADANGLTNVSYSYQWITDDADIKDATTMTYTLTEDDEGKAITVRVSFTDDANNVESLTSEPTGPVVPEHGPLTVFTVVDTSSDTDTVLGTLEDGGTLTLEDPDSAIYGIRVDTDSNDDIDRVNLDLTGAKTANKDEGVFPYSLYGDSGEGDLTGEDLPAGSYELTATAYDDDGDVLGTLTVSFTVTALLPAQQQTVVPNTSATGVPTISGTARVGETLTADTSGIADADGLTNVTFSYQWLADDADIAGATGSTLTLTDAYAGMIVRVEVSFTDDADHEEALTSAATAAVDTPATGLPTISGIAEVGQTLTADTSGIADEDGLDNVAFSYQWVAGGSDIDGATASSYTLTASEEGQTIQAQVTFTDNADSVEALTSAATAAVAPLPVWAADMLVVEYTSVSIGASSADLFSNERGSAGLQVKWLWSYTTDRVLRLAFRESLPGAEDLTLQVGDLTLAFPSGSSRESGFLWNDVDVDWKDGQTISVRIVLTSATVAPQPNTLATGLPAISGTARVGETLKADTSAINDADGLDDATFSYQWMADDTNIQGATDPAYTLAEDDEGKAIKVLVSFTDEAGNMESRTSAPTDAVAAAPAQNSQATGAPTISGTRQVGETLMADTTGINDADGLDDATFSYQWMADDTNIQGATDPAYTLAEDDEGKTIKVLVSFTDDAGNPETLTSDPTGEVEAKPNIQATGLPTISGMAQVGETLTADTSAINDEDGLNQVVFSYQWIRNDGNADEDIAGATGSSYTLTEDDEGKTVKVTVSFTDDSGNTESLPSDPTGEVAAKPNSDATSAPAISGTAQVGETLTANVTGIADEDGLENAEFTYQWIRNDGTEDADIAGATGDTYTPDENDVGKTLKVRVSFTNDADHGETLTSPPTAAVTAPPLTATLDSVPASHDGSTEFTFELHFSEEFKLSYTVLRDYAFTVTGGTVSRATRVDKGFNIKRKIHVQPDGDGAVTIVLPVTTDCADDGAICTVDGRKLSTRLERTVSGPGGAPTTTNEPAPNTQATGQPTISGTVQVGETLIADTSEIADEDGLTNPGFTYQWAKNDGATDTDIQGATASTYTLVSDDEGKTIKVTVSFTDAEGNPETLTSDPTGEVAAKPNIQATGQPTISGTVRVGETLTADVTGIADEDGLDNVVFSYQWMADDTNIQDATGSSYTLVSDDESRTITVTVSFTDAEGNPETLTSDPTGEVAAKPNIQATGLPTISGMAQVGETLTADTSGIDDEDGLNQVVFSYQWIRNDGNADEDIAGATGSSYTLTGDDEGKTIMVTVSFTDAEGNPETLTSNPTGEVAAKPNTSATGQPTISGTIQVGETLTADTSGIADEDGLDNVVFSYQWMADDTNIQDATGSSYTLAEDDEGKAIKVLVSFADDAGNVESRPSAPTDAVAAPPAQNSSATGQPTISGTAQVGQTLTADTSGIDDEDGLNQVVFSYQWVADDEDIAGATGSSYTLTENDKDKAVTVTVSFTDAEGNPETLTSDPTGEVEAKPNTQATGQPTISGTVRVGETLTADVIGIADEDGLDNVVFSYQWMADDTNIQNATGSSYTLVSDDEGKTITVTVSFTDAEGNPETLSSDPTGEVAAKPNTQATGQPSISGTALVGQTLTADTSGIDDEDGLDNVVFSYQWVRNDGKADEDIQDATGSSYTLTEDDEGTVIKVTVSFDDDAGNAESLPSDATGEVESEAGPLTGFTLVGAADPDQAVLWKHQTDGSKPEEGDTWKEWTDGGTLSLGDPESGRYGIRAEIESDTGIHRVALELTLESTGEQRADRTDDAAPYSLYGDEGEEALHGESLPVGSYTLKATAYTEEDEILGSLEISFTVALAKPGRPQTLKGEASAQRIDLAWKAPSDSVFTHYVIYRAELENGQLHGKPMTKYATIDATGKAMTYTDDNVEEGVEYRYRVAAVNSAGEGKKSTWLDITAE